MNLFQALPQNLILLLAITETSQNDEMDVATLTERAKNRKIRN